MLVSAHDRDIYTACLDTLYRYLDISTYLHRVHHGDRGRARHTRGPPRHAEADVPRVQRRQDPRLHHLAAGGQGPWITVNIFSST